MGVRDVFTLIKSRPEAIFIWSWSTLIACLIVNGGLPPLGETFTVVGASALLAASAYIYNDLIDAEMDRYNPDKKARPIAAGEVSEGFALGFVVATGVLGLALASLLNRAAFLFEAAFYVLYMLYSYPPVRFKKMFILKEVVSCSGWVLLALAGVYATTGAFSFKGIFAGVMMGVFSFLGLPALSDSLDETEDALFEVNSLARSLTWRQRVLFLGAAIGVLTVSTLVGYRPLGFNGFLPVAVVASSLFLLSRVRTIVEGYDREKVLRVRSYTYYYVILSTVYMILGALNLPFF